jgi:hypothetical protein
MHAPHARLVLVPIMARSLDAGKHESAIINETNEFNRMVTLQNSLSTNDIDQ